MSKSSDKVTIKESNAPKPEYNPSDTDLLAEYRKENIHLQKQIAKMQVKHESEINKLTAELEEANKRTPFSGFTVNTVKSTDNTKSKDS